MLDGFKKFIARGNMVDMAVGVVMGAAVTSVVTAIVEKVINPLIAMIFGKGDMSGLLAFTANGSTVSFGAVLGAHITFLVAAAAVSLCIVLPTNKFRDMSAARHGVEDEEEEPLSPEEQTVALLQEIRDELAKGNNAGSILK